MNGNGETVRIANTENVANTIVEGVEEKVLITKDVEEVIKRLLQLPLMLLRKTVMSVGETKGEAKDCYFDENGLHISIVDKQKGEKKFLIPFDQINRIIGAIK